MKKLLGLMLVLALASSALGINWDGSTDQDWATAANWNTPEAAPTSTDWANINMATGNTPIIGTGDVAVASGVSLGASSTVTGQSGLLTMDGGTLKVWNSTTTAMMLGGNAALDIGTLTVNSGHIEVRGGITLARKSIISCIGVINMNGGILDFGTASNQSLWMNYTANTLGYAIINMGNAGVIRGDNLQMVIANPNGNINFTAGSNMAARIELTYVAGFPDATWDAFVTRITGYAGRMSNETFIINDSLQRITIVPEPATVALLGLGGLALIRKRR